MMGESSILFILYICLTS